MNLKKVLVVGAGPAGSTIARHFAEEGYHVDLFDERHHIAGNCYDAVNTHGHLLHIYGPHYFRTNSNELLAWLSQFTDWIDGQYYVKAKIGTKEVPLPISLATMLALKNRPFSVGDFENYLQAQRQNFSNITNAEEQCLSTVGKELYELFFKNYTIKQWGYHPNMLDPSVTARIPLRFNDDIRYPSETHQVLPKEGYTVMFQRLLDHPHIHLTLNHPLPSSYILSHRKEYDAVFYTGAIDSFFNFRFGKLLYRSLRFEWRHLPNVETFLTSVQLNFPNDHEYTRIVESKHITHRMGQGTTLCYEYPTDQGEPFYPMPLKSQQEKYSYYAKLGTQEENHAHPLFFVGRLAEYKYYNMDHIFLRSMNLAKDVLKRLK
jgi:UDP-galactopyranose mutase